MSSAPILHGQAIHQGKRHGEVIIYSGHVIVILDRVADLGRLVIEEDLEFRIEELTVDFVASSDEDPIRAAALQLSSLFQLLQLPIPEAETIALCLAIHIGNESIFVVLPSFSDHSSH